MTAAQPELAPDPTPDHTLDEIRAALAPVLPSHAAFDGWSDAALIAASEEIGVDVDVARLAFPGGGSAMIDAWFGHVDAEMARRLPADVLAAMKIRARIAALVEARMAIVAPHREALRRAMGVLALPTNLATGARLLWRAVDAMWRLAGDVATDYNHYTKRLTLAAVYGATMTVFLDDDSEGHADTRAFLARRIDSVMAIEKAKAGARARTENLPSLARFVGRLRYPAR